MLFVVNDNLNPHYNLALEEYLLRGLKKPAIMLWRNSKSVIIGCNQNASLEINEKFALENDITIARRITGGGAVFHDLGNINYTIISENVQSVGQYDSFTSDLRGFLKELGIDTTLSGRNDILLNNSKICGNAQAIKGDMLIHHGCILFSTDISKLSGALKVNELKYKYNGIKSVKSRVVNIVDFIEQKLTPEKFLAKFKDYLIKNNNLEVYHLTEKDMECVDKLYKEKYSTYDWIFGESPKYNFKNAIKTNAGVVEINLEIENSIIKKAKIFGDFFNLEDIKVLEQKLIGLSHTRAELVKNIKNIDKFILNLTDEEFVELLTNKD